MDTETDRVLDASELNRLRWRLRRGLLENDLFIERFLEAHGASLTTRQVRGLEALMALADNDLLDLFLRRREPDGAIDTPEVREVLALARRPAAVTKEGNPE